MEGLMYILITILLSGIIYRLSRPSDQPEPIEEEPPVHELNGTGYRYKIPLAGVRHKNADGSSRQKIIKTLSIGSNIDLIPEPENPYDPNAVACYYNSRQVGYLMKRDNLQVLDAINKGTNVIAKVHTIEPDDEKPGNFFVHLAIYYNR